MAKRTRTPSVTRTARTKPTGRSGRPGIVHTSVYLPNSASGGGTDKASGGASQMPWTGHSEVNDQRGFKTTDDLTVLLR